MKKHLGLFLVFVVVFSILLGVDIVRATGPYNEEQGGAKAENGTVRPGFLRGQAGEDKKEFKGKVSENKFEFPKDRNQARKAFFEDLKAKRESFKAELKARKEEWKTLQEEKRQEFCGKAREVVTNRFGFAITELEKFQTKLSDVISKLKTEGKDTADAETSLKLSKDKLAEAKTKLADIKKLVPEGSTCKDITPETFEKIKLGTREARDLLKEAKEELKNTIKEIRALKTPEDTEEDKDSAN